MSMNRFAHANASSIEETIEALNDTCRPLAGGTDLLDLIKTDLAAPERLVNVKTIPALDQVERDTDGWRIGATVTLSRLAAAPSISGSPELAALYGAILNSASPQLRHMATIGGNLLQKPRCWYYRNKLTHCWRKGGRMCYAYRGQNKYHVILNGGPCYAVHPSDPAVALLALDAGVTLVGPQGTRSLTLGDFYHKPGRESRNATTLGADELITEINVPAQAEGSRSAYVKVAERAVWDFALGSAAARLTMADDVVQEARLCLGGVANVPWRAEAAEDVLAGGELSDEAIERAATAATTEAKPLEHNAYKVDLIQGAIREVLRRLRDQ